jgi:hypothetical protein
VWCATKSRGGGGVGLGDGGGWGVAGYRGGGGDRDGGGEGWGGGEAAVVPDAGEVGEHGDDRELVQRLAPGEGRECVRKGGALVQRRATAAS